MTNMLITIDGPAGAGKTSVSRELAKRLNCIYVDTGALYRGVALEVKQAGIDWEADAVLEPFLNRISLSFAMEGEDPVLTSSGKNISSLIRTPEISMLASAISARPCVRKALLGLQHAIAKNNDTVFEGRDMGTVVFPHARHKFFLFADLDTRALRRFKEKQAPEQDLVQVKEMMESRDANDAGREIAPLTPAKDAVLIDSTHISLEEVVQRILLEIHRD
ncbi:cytidylate kinase [Desulfocicer vacuolatum DSM 3385]|uniref:Cytidylate kinase n=1 Tax=Desulfocicer vacuolatum DSM 3385 TaxID=1121400 RepID=A0A1W2E2I2_9BACT|nr:(d)CMP kinase [Desulfocicer vacuolatum]SMD04024.1 cytidylate kinase [Desulfocicer vacuolatum DSM 3385]